MGGKVSQYSKRCLYSNLELSWIEGGCFPHSIWIQNSSLVQMHKVPISQVLQRHGYGAKLVKQSLVIVHGSKEGG
ncbi:hypothetical protein DIC66_11660 [Rhodoferax lacus]|uniref:Uncharacterized protein n=1 Tax=Rhodoferax lacus TaxID=2184758 RepID=A0A3E1RDJ0_9BURK|nr:hypothetical protein DIC66_11660 [Rhodoferax lacus]